jgi:hypothetical protein
MDISKWKILFKLVFGGVDSVVEYLLDILNGALATVKAGDRVKIQAALNVAERVLGTLNALKWLCPTKWQTANGSTVEAVQKVCSAFDDLQVTAEELAGIRSAFAAAVAAWKGGDDETCVDCTDCEDCAL